jgi:hypothetical protein
VIGEVVVHKLNTDNLNRMMSRRLGYDRVFLHVEAYEGHHYWAGVLGNKLKPRRTAYAEDESDVELYYKDLEEKLKAFGLRLNDLRDVAKSLNCAR